MTLSLRNVTLSPRDGSAPLVRGLTFDLPEGQILTVVGPSGIGKSTLLDFIGGHLTPHVAASGRVIVDGRDVTDLPAEDRRIGILFQDSLLFPHLTVGENLAFGLPSRLRGRAQRKAAVSDALASAGMSGFEDRNPATLSGGERGRVALMRTLLAEPRVLLLDEPFARLDPARRVELRTFVFVRARELGIPVLLVTHDSDDARDAGGPLITLG